ncbi:unnamed protein product [Boreogadus saida]
MQMRRSEAGQGEGGGVALSSCSHRLFWTEEFEPSAQAQAETADRPLPVSYTGGTQGTANVGHICIAELLLAINLGMDKT